MYCKSNELIPAICVLQICLLVTFASNVFYVCDYVIPFDVVSVVKQHVIVIRTALFKAANFLELIIACSQCISLHRLGYYNAQCRGCK